MARRQALSPPVADPPRPLEGARIGRLATTAAHGALAVAKLIHTEPYGGAELPPVQSCLSRPERMPAMHKFRYRQKDPRIRRRHKPRRHQTGLGPFVVSDRPTEPPTRRSHLQRACRTRRRAFQIARLPRHIREVLSGWITASNGQAPLQPPSFKQGVNVTPPTDRLFGRSTVGIEAPSSSTGGSTKSATLAVSSLSPHAHLPMMSAQGLYGGNPLKSSLEECFKAKREEWLTMTREKELKALSKPMTYWVNFFESECKKKPESSSIITDNFEDDGLGNFKLETDELEPGTFKCSSITVKQFFEYYGDHVFGFLQRSGRIVRVTAEYRWQLTRIGFFILKDLFFRKPGQLNELLADIWPDNPFDLFDPKKKIEIALAYSSLTDFDDTNLDEKIYSGAQNGYLAAKYGAAYATKPFQRHLLWVIQRFCDDSAKTFRKLVAENLKRIEGGAEEFGSFIDSVENQDAFLKACFEAEASRWLYGHNQKCPFQPTDGRSAISEAVKFCIAYWKALVATPEQTDKFREDINKFLRVVEQAIATAKSCACSKQGEMRAYINKLQCWHSEASITSADSSNIITSADSSNIITSADSSNIITSADSSNIFTRTANWLRNQIRAPAGEVGRMRNDVGFEMQSLVP